MHFNSVSLIFPHQIYQNLPKIFSENKIYIIEENLFFKHFNFHIQKLVFQRLILRNYEKFLKKKSYITEYIPSSNKLSDIRKLIVSLSNDGVNEVHFFDPVDNYLSRRICRLCDKYSIKMVIYESLSFLNSIEYNEGYFDHKKKKFRHNDFYKKQRTRLDILMDKDIPVGGQLSFDNENRNKYPSGLLPPKITFSEEIQFLEVQYSIISDFPNSKGSKSIHNFYPTSFDEAEKWFDKFLIERMNNFGTYEDAIISDEVFLNHSVISPLLNTGLLTPEYIVKKSITFASENNIEINDIEGFIRQIIGWREFIRGLYIAKGTFSRNLNHFNCTRSIPNSFYNGTTGIIPIDDTINKINKYAYCHHIERLMILGNFMLLCEFKPDDVYKWFMELFIDSYDWVMVPNIYGMSQFADGGLFSSKPYISSSNYIIKMSNYKKGDWSNIWDALFWRFMNKHRDKLSLNPRLNMLLANFDKMSEKRKDEINFLSNNFLNNF